ncbi:MAG: thiolase family protein [Nitrosopumilaceae archaeon]|nr:thiolase family protein [Nitrosopumilaceae archaeon]
MNRVFITNYSSTNFSLENIDIKSIMLSAVQKLICNSQIDKKLIDGILVSSTSNSKYLAAQIAESTGITPKIFSTIENLCSSGTHAIVTAFAYVSSGLANAVIVVGADLYNTPGKIFDSDESRGDYTHPIFWASLFTKAHKRKYNTTELDLAIISKKNYDHSINNPYAYNNKHYTITEIINSKKITDDLNILHCSKLCTGCSAIMMMSESYAKKFTENSTAIIGIGQSTTSSVFTKNDLTSMESTKRASIDAFSMCKLTPSEIDVAEVHDAFSICEIMAIEDLGFVNKGQGTTFSNELYQTNNNKINPRGGLIGSGHPLGATGISQTIEIVQQLQNQAGKRQVHNAKYGLVHNMSAAATSSTVLILT